MSLPRPEPGLVICYSYLWLREHSLGREEGAKDRPCAIVMVVEGETLHPRVVVVPITHSQPADPAEAIEMPPATKRRLGLDGDRSWIVLSEANIFLWPGPDLRRIDGRPDAPMAYGVLPPRFFERVRKRMVGLLRTRRSKTVPRGQ